MGLKAAVQALQKAEKLKEKVQSSRDLLNDNAAWISQQQLQRIYQQVLILDLEYALDRKVEQDLWSLGFKNYIGTLQSLAKDKKNPKRSESQAMLSWCLEAASGFYLTLLQDICTAFDLDLPFRRKGSVYGSGNQWKAIEELNPPQSSSCNYICQHCLVHLGDIARYRSQNRQAEAFYRHAVLPAPSNGHPYNQLALLEASRGDRLSTVFHYVRSVAVRHPFPAAATNLALTFNKSVEEKLNVDGRPKLSVLDYVSVFLKLHGLLHAGIDLHLAEKCVKLLTTTLTAHVATETLTSWKLVQMLVINFFALHHAGSCADAEKITTFSDSQLSSDERRSKRLVTDLMAGSLSAFLLPVYTLKEGETLLEYFALPAIKLTLDWIRLDPKVLLDPAFTSRLQIWPSLCKLLNGLQPTIAEFDSEKYSYVPLPEDRDLQCFLPLEKAFTKLRFSCNDWKSDPPSLNKLRASRLVTFGRWLADNEHYRLITKCTSPVVNEAALVFEAVGGQQMPPSDLIRELEELSLAKLSSPAPSESSSWGSSATGASTPDNLLAARSQPSPPDHGTEQAPHNDGTLERRAGILKPQGSLEKSREKEPAESVWPVNSVPMIAKRGHQNVALQAIMRKANATSDQDRTIESKQVTFKSPSPTNVPFLSPESDSQLKPNKVPTWQQQQQQQLKIQQLFKQKQVISNQQTSIHYPYQNPPLTHNVQQSVRPTTFNNVREQIPQQNVKTPYNSQYVSNSLAFHQPPPPPSNPVQESRNGMVYPDQLFGVPASQATAQYSQWLGRNDAPPMPPTAWCGSENRRVTRPPGMENPAEVSLGTNQAFPGNNYLHGNYPQRPEESFTNWNVRTPPQTAMHHKLVNDPSMGHFGALGSRPSAMQNNVRPPQRSQQHGEAMFGQEQDGENLTMFSSGFGSSTFNVGTSNTYSLFSSPNWVAPASCGIQSDSNGLKTGLGVIGMPNNGSLAMGQQSLWSGPGPSPLERLLEQQKQLREGPAPKGGT